MYYEYVKGTSFNRFPQKLLITKNSSNIPHKIKFIKLVSIIYRSEQQYLYRETLDFTFAKRQCSVFYSLYLKNNGYVVVFFGK